jgi:type I restriction enzyme S subunit
MTTGTGGADVGEDRLPPGWNEVRLGDVCRLVNGDAYRESDWSRTGVPIIRIQNLNDHRKTFNYWAGPLDGRVIVNPGDVLLAWSGTPGTSFGAHIWTRETGVLNQHIFRVDLDHSRLIPEWALPAINEQLNVLIDAAHGGVGLRHVSKGQTESLRLKLPPIAEQKRLAAALHGKLQLVEQAKKAADERNRANLDLLAAFVAEGFGQGGCRLCPRRRLRDVCDPSRPITYGVIQTGDPLPNGVPTVRAGDLQAFKVKLSELKRIRPEIAAEYDRTVLRGDEILMAIRGSVGAVAEVTPDLIGANVSREVAVLPIREGVNRRYVFWALRGPLARQATADKITGAAQRGINLADVERLEIPWPAETEQERLVDSLDARSRQVESLGRALQEELAAIQRLPGTILRHAFRGEL